MNVSIPPDSSEARRGTVQGHWLEPPPLQGPTASCGLLACQEGRGSRTMAVIHLAGVGRRATARRAELTVSDKRTFSRPRPLGSQS